MDMQATGLYLVAATGLLGSPGPGIAALLAVGKSVGWTRSLPFFLGLQIGLGAALAASGAGLMSVLTAYPRITQAMTVLAAAYLLYLAYAIATSAVGAAAPSEGTVTRGIGSAAPGVGAGVPTHDRRSRSAASGLLLGLTNPKAYLAFASLLASPLHLVSDGSGNVVAKVVVTMLVIVSVDLIWLGIGVTLRRSQLTARSERVLNGAMGAMVALAAVLMFV